jgi:hypothetical protein
MIHASRPQLRTVESSIANGAGNDWALALPAVVDVPDL